MLMLGCLVSVVFAYVFAMLLEEVIVQSEKDADITSLKFPILIKLLVHLTTFF
jgi:hypothetical protein